MEEVVSKEKLEKNVKIYKKYKMFGYDWLFYYAINVLYLTVAKGFTMSQIMYILSAYTFAIFLWQMPANILIQKLKLRDSIVLGNFLNVAACVLYIVSNNFTMFIIANVICALGATLKSVSEVSLLYSSLKNLDKREDFSKVEGISNSRYYYLEGVCSVLAGFLFLINPYIPMIWCLGGNIIAYMMSTELSNTKIEQDNNKEVMNFRDFIKGFTLVLKSKRAKSIFIFAAIFTGLISISSTLYKAILIDLGMTAQYLAIIFAVFTVFTGIGAKSLYFIEKKTKNKTLSIFGVIFAMLLILIGTQGLDLEFSYGKIGVIIGSLAVMAVIQGAYRVGMKKYLISFTTSEIRTKITSIYYISENLGATILYFLSGVLLDVTTNGQATILMSVSCLILILFAIIYMKDKLGLKPEEYDKKDLYNRELK